MNKNGFTLAEVLITIGIIGVVAALTIPTLNNHSTEVEFRSAFKKGIAALNQTITMNVALDNVDFNSLTSTAIKDKSADSLYSVLVNRMSTVKFLDVDDASKDAKLLNIGGVANVGSSSAKASDGSEGKGSGNVAMFFTDGSCIIWNPEKSTVSKNSSGIMGIRAIWDVNGSKKPNRLTWCDSAAKDDAEKRNKMKKATDDTEGNCNDNSVVIRDQYSILLNGNRVYPNGKAAHYLFYSK